MAAGELIGRVKTTFVFEVIARCFPVLLSENEAWWLFIRWLNPLYARQDICIAVRSHSTALSSITVVALGGRFALLFYGFQFARSRATSSSLGGNSLAAHA